MKKNTNLFSFTFFSDVVVTIHFLIFLVLLFWKRSVRRKYRRFSQQVFSGRKGGLQLAKIQAREGPGRTEGPAVGDGGGAGVLAQLARSQQMVSSVCACALAVVSRALGQQRSDMETRVKFSSIKSCFETVDGMEREGVGGRNCCMLLCYIHVIYKNTQEDHTFNDN